VPRLGLLPDRLAQVDRSLTVHIDRTPWTPTPTTTARLAPTPTGSVLPLVASWTGDDGTGGAMAGLLRPGNAGSNTTEHHLELVDRELAVAEPKMLRYGGGMWPPASSGCNAAGHSRPPGGHLRPAAGIAVAWPGVACPTRPNPSKAEASREGRVCPCRFL
jgi:hypothetical protein